MLDYAALYRPLHEASGGKFFGGKIRGLEVVIDLVAQTKPRNLLDYGCQPPHATVLTPSGWRVIGDLKIGDSVIGASGEGTKVTGLHSPGVVPIFRVTFNDGAS